jgi:hypothetical protein
VTTWALGTAPPPVLADPGVPECGGVHRGVRDVLRHLVGAHQPPSPEERPPASPSSPPVSRPTRIARPSAPGRATARAYEIPRRPASGPRTLPTAPVRQSPRRPATSFIVLIHEQRQRNHAIRRHPRRELPALRWAFFPVTSTASSTASAGTQDISTPREIWP